MNFSEKTPFLKDAASLLTVGSFLLTVELFYVQLEKFGFFTYNWSFFFAYNFSIFAYNWSFFAYSGKVCLRRALRDCKQRSLTVSKKTPTVSKKNSFFSKRPPFSEPDLGKQVRCPDHMVREELHGMHSSQKDFEKAAFILSSARRLFGERLRGNRNRGQQACEVLRGKPASERVSESVSDRGGFQRFSEVFRGFERFSEVFRGFSEALSEPLSECHFPLRVADPVAPNRVAP